MRVWRRGAHFGEAGIASIGVCATSRVLRRLFGDGGIRLANRRRNLFITRHQHQPWPWLATVVARSSAA